MGRERTVRRQQRGTLQLGLGDEQATEGVAVVRWQRRDAQGVGGGISPREGVEEVVG